MARFRKNHIREQRKGAGSYLFRIVLFGAFFILGAIYLYRFLSENIAAPTDVEYEIPPAETPEDRYFLPTTNSGTIVHHDFYSLSYVEKFEQAEWVAYELTRESLKKPNVPRAKNFKPDYNVSTGSAFHRDYTHSGYTRGHLVPAADMAFDTKAMEQTFFMSNISPQLRAFNNGIWRELEEQTRDWAFQNNRIYVVSGPVLNNIQKRIGKNRVAVPDKFFKVLIDVSGKNKKGIGFVIPNELSERPLHDFSMPIDSVEAMVGIDFFDELISDDLEESLEGSFNEREWKVSEKRYRLRRDKWNFQ